LANLIEPKWHKAKRRSLTLPKGGIIIKTKQKNTPNKNKLHKKKTKNEQKTSKKQTPRGGKIDKKETTLKNKGTKKKRS